MKAFKVTKQSQRVTARTEIERVPIFIHCMRRGVDDIFRYINEGSNLVWSDVRLLK